MITQISQSEYQRASILGRPIEKTTLVRFYGMFYMRTSWEQTSHYFKCDEPDEARLLHHAKSFGEVVAYRRRVILNDL
jgi:hypothetical protein